MLANSSCKFSLRRYLLPLTDRLTHAYQWQMQTIKLNSASHYSEVGRSERRGDEVHLISSRVWCAMYMLLPYYVSCYPVKYVASTRRSSTEIRTHAIQWLTYNCITPTEPRWIHRGKPRGISYSCHGYIMELLRDLHGTKWSAWGWPLPRILAGTKTKLIFLLVLCFTYFRFRTTLEMPNNSPSFDCCYFTVVMFLSN